jgi:rubrerythrin
VQGSHQAAALSNSQSLTLSRRLVFNFSPLLPILHYGMSGAEIFGLAGGVAALPGVFTSCIDCFEYIQFSRHFGHDYQRSVLKLDIAANRLSRWGEAIGLCDAAFTIDLSAKEMPIAAETLGEILNLFQILREKSQKFAAKTKQEDLVVFNPDLDHDSRIGPLHKQLQGLAISRQERSKARHKSVGLVQKASWALYEKNRFEVLIDDVRVLIDALIEMLPGKAVTSQRRIAALEASLINDPAALQLLVDITDKDDPLLHEVAEEIHEKRNGQVFKNNVVVGNSRVRMGNEYHDGWIQGAQKSSQVWERNKVSDEAKVQMGNRYGGRGIFGE